MTYFAPLDGVIGAGVVDPIVPVPIVLVPMLLDPMPLLPDVDPDDPIEPDDPDERDVELEESVDGVVIGAGVGTVPVSSTFLPQAPRASSAASATVVRAAVLTFGVRMRISLSDR